MIAISTDDGERGRARQEWQLGDLAVGYGLADRAGARLGALHLERARQDLQAGIEEPTLFNEPGLFLVPAPRLARLAAVQFGAVRPAHLDEVLKAIDFIKERNYPPRGDA